MDVLSFSANTKLSTHKTVTLLFLVRSGPHAPRKEECRKKRHHRGLASDTQSLLWGLGLLQQPLPSVVIPVRAQAKLVRQCSTIVIVSVKLDIHPRPSPCLLYTSPSPAQRGAPQGPRTESPDTKNTMIPAHVQHSSRSWNAYVLDSLVLCS